VTPRNIANPTARVVELDESEVTGSAQELAVMQDKPLMELAGLEPATSWVR
jgi:hypothetical protein